MGRGKTRYFVSFAAVAIGVVAIACSGAAPATAPAAGTRAAPAAASTPTIVPQPTTPPIATPTITAPEPTSAPTPGEQKGSTSGVQSDGAFTWEVEEVDGGTKPALALNSDGTPRIAYMLEDISGFVKSAARNGSGWDISTVAKGYFYGPLDLAIGGDDVPRIVYHDHQAPTFMQDKGDAVVASLENGKWNNEAITDAGHDGWDTRIVVDDNGRIHISAIDPMEFGGDGVEYYSQDDSGEWSVENVGSGELTYQFATSVAVAPDGTPYITYLNQDDNDLILATREAGGWTLERVDTAGDTGFFAQMVITPDGRFHISYFQMNGPKTGVVKYATKGPEDSDWEIREIGNLDQVVLGFTGARNITSIAVDSEGSPWIAYSDEKNLNLAVWDGSDWQISNVVDAGSKTLGQLVSLKLDSQDEPHIAYFEVTNTRPLSGVVMYAKGTTN